MKPPNCFICKRRVLEFQGQFDKLDTYLLSSDDAALKQGAYGWCHMRCLLTSKWGAFWAKRRIWHRTEVMSYKKIGSSDNLTALFHPRRKTIAVFQTNGESFYFEPPELDLVKKSDEGILLPVSEVHHLHLDDPIFVQEIKDTLIKRKSFPLINLFKSLGLEDTLLYPEKFTDSVLKFDKELMEEWKWKNSVSAIAVYNQFIPLEVADFVKEISYQN